MPISKETRSGGSERAFDEAQNLLVEDEVTAAEAAHRGEGGLGGKAHAVGGQVMRALALQEGAARITEATHCLAGQAAREQLEFV